MKFTTWTLLALSLIFASGAELFAASLTGDPMAEKIQHFIQKSDNQVIEVDFILPGVDYISIEHGQTSYDLFSLEGEGVTGTIGAPELPVITRLFAIPNSANVKIAKAEPVYRTYQGIFPYPHQEYEYGHPQHPEQLSFDNTYYQKSAQYPEQWLTLGTPAIMRDYRVIQVNIHPIRVNPVTGEAEILQSLHLELEFDNNSTVNIKTHSFDKTVTSFSQTYQNLITNYPRESGDWINPNGEDVKGSILIVYPNVAGVSSTIAPLVEWKKRLGYNTVAVQVANGASTTTVYNAIQSAYNAYDPPLEFVTLIGDVGGTIGLNCYTWNSGFYNGASDHQYACQEGGDILADVFVGRISVSSSSELQTAINKILYYEQNPMTTSTAWYKKGMVVAGSSSSGYSTITVGRTIRHWWLEDGFTQVDTMWYNMGGSIPTFMTNTINSGISALNFRGYIGTSGFDQDDIMALTNAGKLPFGVIVTCGTGDYNIVGNEVCEAWLRAGSPSNPTGGIGGVGTSTSGTHTRFNNTVCVGMYGGLHYEGISQLGPMLFRGKYEMFLSYLYDQPGLDNFTHWNNLMGDPSTDLWNDIPQTITVTYPTTIGVGASSFTVTAADYAGNPLEDRYVTLIKDGETFVGGRTDENGVYTSAINVPTAGTLKVTVTYHNDRPHLGNVTVVAQAVYPSCNVVTIDDDNLGASSGNNDEDANPGETLELDVQLKNFGTTTSATGVSAVLSSTDDKVTVTTANVTYPNLAVNAAAYGNSKFVVQMGSDFPDEYVVPFSLSISANEGTFTSAFNVEVVSGLAVINSAVFSGGGLQVGGSSNVTLTLRNAGSFNLTGVTAVVTSNDDQITITDPNGTFGSINAGATATNTGDLFTIAADNLASNGHTVDAELTLTSSNGFSQVIPFSFMIGNYSAYDPFGPDDYGYYCIDNTDVEYSGFPLYNWVEISALGTQISLGDYGNEQDASARVILPFDFTYYGESFDTLAVCSNGWIGFGNEVYHTDFRNYSLPCVSGPSRGMLCPYWDDLVMGSGHVYSYYDQTNHTYIIEYNNVALMSGGQAQKFEVILYDPAFYPTPTGDGEILFLYSYINPSFGSGTDNAYFTTGIMSNDHLDGLQYAYWNIYHPAASPLTLGNRAVKFTTIEPVRVPQSQDFTVTLTPTGSTTIPAGGGNLAYSITIANLGATPAPVDVWINATLPSGGSSGNLLVRQNILIASGGSLSRNMTQWIPASAPAGNYIYNAYAGEYTTLEVWDEDHFTFTKTAVDGQSPAGAVGDNWNLTGWEEIPAFAGMTAELPEKYELGNAFPNPFNPRAEIAFALPQTERVTLVVHNTLGRQVAVLADGWREAGWHSVDFNGADLSSGLYFYTIKAGNFSQTKKMLLVK